MNRILTTPRNNWQQRLEELGFGFHSLEDAYWDESAYYEFSRAETDNLEKATGELWEMYLEAVEHVISKNLFFKFQIPEWFRKPITDSWENDAPSIYGRFDLGYDGNQIKLLEFNADTPTSLFEGSVVQWYWLKDKFPENDQFNSIHEKLVEYWKYLRPYLSCDFVHFASLTNIEDVTTVEYMRDCASQAGLETQFISVQDIGWAEEIKEFIDENREVMQVIFKLYPYEWILAEEFGKHVAANLHKTQWIEPAWKMLASSKAMLPVLWELFPNHPYLLESYFEPRHLVSYAKKPLYSREGANISLFRNYRPVEENSGNYGKEGYIYQQLFDLPNFNGNFPVIGSWIVGQEPAGIGVRESVNLITNNQSRFVPHLISQ
ncbi:glutathionylspermidine synthase family protein [Kaistella sp. PBT33-4]|uniref:glutathionylspermidine synthase family protein n=1 Tax=Kaistella sp. PBT33-4 TaxID=3032000 RepID=UPI0023D87357|nr:glutathionylspermidine synthase family protein [Kaistella sp. PBT33-4]MDF0719239.1 glutathionylspermidine synthase family protein [Kaistella sp. PBT33-4]